MPERKRFFSIDPFPKEQIRVLPVQGLCRCHHSRAPSSPKEPQPNISWPTFSWFRYTSHLRKCQSLHLIKTCKIWPLKGTSVLSPANCLRYESCEQKSVPAKHVYLKIKKFISVVFGGWFEGSQKNFLFWRVLGVLYHWFDAGFTWTQVRHNSQQGHIFPSQNFILLALYKCQDLLIFTM